MPKITYLKEFEGAVWARLELDLASKDMPVHVLTNDEIKQIRANERKAVWEELNRVVNRYDDDNGD